MADAFNLNGFGEVLKRPFPADTKQAAGIVNGVITEVLSVGFSDRILVTISQGGRLAHWVRSQFKQKAGCNPIFQLTSSAYKAPRASRKQQPGHRRVSYSIKWRRRRQPSSSIQFNCYDAPWWSCSRPRHHRSTSGAADW
jgi:hypothetical protein